ncbi:subclass B1 metallo-beta-lactamase [Maribacter sp. HTCC2170]|uniref:subclass B1 metallo-beta-lactamase n=1 Tax=Maribacter sp. (strain HTCC2170 / KCCM 42371) TaxID=313603 RepID=UPI00006B6EA9|nr:subclass B1 metallo-beta-lactamase [Maribacter sp. HTCC2170]EAQ99664.1 beta-lactamase II [Maribacter sp. HTCC2170]
MKIKYTLFLVSLILIIGCKAQNSTNSSFESENLRIKQLTENTYVHISYLETDTWGKVPCKGMIVTDNGEAIVFDTPTNDVASVELLNWLKNDLKYQVNAVVATHFHVDCIGGLKEFHKNNIPSYATNMTIDLMKNGVVPENGFDKYLELKVGNKKVVSQYFGGGHTSDNIVGYFSSEKVLFGGCLVKSIGAGKGNLEDADVQAWSKTVENVKKQFKKVEVVIPGHGEAGNAGLLDYTIELFKQE